MKRRIDKEYWHLIWKNFKSGDRGAFHVIYHEFVDPLFSYGLRITSDRDLVKDAIQDLFIDIYNSGTTLRKPESLEYYLYKTLKRIIIRKLVEQKKYISVQEINDVFELDFKLEEEFLIGEEEEQLTVLRNELSDLKPTKRELLFLKFNSGLTYKEIGKLLDIKPNTVKKQTYRILEKLRKKMVPEFIAILLTCCTA